MLSRLWEWVRVNVFGLDPKPFQNEHPNDQIITVHPGPDGRGRICRAEAWGAEDRTVCPFHRQGICRLWGYDLERDPTQAANCDVSDLLIPIPDD